MATVLSERAGGELSFRTRWTVATTIGSLIGGTISGGLILADQYRYADVTDAATAVAVSAVGTAVAFGARGVALGATQSVALRQVVARWPLWFVATAAGWLLGGLACGAWVGAFGGALTGVGPDYGPIGVVAAFASGVFFLLPLVLQALALSGQVARPGRWVPIAAVRQLAAAGVAFPAMVMVGLALRWEFPSAQAWAFAGVVEGLIEGALTGPVLLRLVREPGPG